MNKICTRNVLWRSVLVVVVFMGISEPLCVAVEKSEDGVRSSSALVTPFQRFKKKAQAFIKCARDRNCKRKTKAAVITAAVVLLAAILKYKLGIIREQDRLENKWAELFHLLNSIDERIKALPRTNKAKKKLATTYVKARGAWDASQERDPELRYKQKQLTEARRLANELEAGLKAAEGGKSK